MERLVLRYRVTLFYNTYSYNLYSQGTMLAAVIPLTVLYAASRDVPGIIKRADQLYEDNKIQELYEYMMQFTDIQSAEIQWRCSRACYKLSILPSTDKNEAKRLAHACLAFAKQAVELDNDNFQCHKVCSKIT